jgi:hypothetical protein
MLSVLFTYCCAECRYAECRGATLPPLVYLQTGKWPTLYKQLMLNRIDPLSSNIYTDSQFLQVS